jgi:hypothetical protein
MKDIIFRLSPKDKQELKIKLAILDLTMQDYLTALVYLDREKNLIKAAKQ